MTRKAGRRSAASLLCTIYYGPYPKTEREPVDICPHCGKPGGFVERELSTNELIRRNRKYLLEAMISAQRHLAEEHLIGFDDYGYTTVSADNALGQRKFIIWSRHEGFDKLSDLVDDLRRAWIELDYSIDEWPLIGIPLQK